MNAQERTRRAILHVFESNMRERDNDDFNLYGTSEDIATQIEDRLYTENVVVVERDYVNRLIDRINADYETFVLRTRAESVKLQPNDLDRPPVKGARPYTTRYIAFRMNVSEDRIRQLAKRFDIGVKTGSGWYAFSQSDYEQFASLTGK